MFEPRHNILSNIRTNVRKYVVTWLEHSRESNKLYPDHSAELVKLLLIRSENEVLCKKQAFRIYLNGDLS